MLSNEHISIVLHTGKNEFTKNIRRLKFVLRIFLYGKYDCIDLIQLVIILYSFND